MANKILDLRANKTSKSISTNEVYIDVDMISRYDTGKMSGETEPKSEFKIKKLINQDSVFNSLKNIFTWIPGERIINPEFGSKLRRLLYEGITKNTEDRIVSEIKSCVSIWEPRVTIENIVNVSDITDTEDNIIALDINYKIKGLDEVFTYTYKQNISK